MNAQATRSDSVVTELDTADGPMIVKHHRAEADLTRPPAVRARHEFETLTLLRERLPASFTVPRATALDEDAGSVTMERAPGTPLDILLREAKRTANAAETLEPSFARAGEWLRAMQQATMRSTPSACEVLHAQVELATRDAQAVYRGTMQRRVIAALHELEHEIAPSTETICGHHGDYWPGNVFLAPDRVTVIDFEGYREGHPVEDVAYFLTQVRLLLPRHAGLLPSLSRAFLRGWGGDEHEAAMRLFTLTKILRLLARNAGSQHSFLIRTWIRHTLRKTVERCLP